MQKFFYAEQCLLKKIGYMLPKQSNNIPSLSVQIAHLIIILSTICYTCLTIWDIEMAPQNSTRTYILLLLSTLIIICTQYYKYSIGIQEEKRSLSHYKNREDKKSIKNKRKTKKLKRELYIIPLAMELIVTCIAIVFIIIINIHFKPCAYIFLQGILWVLAIINCVMLYIDCLSEYHRAVDYIEA